MWIFTSKGNEWIVENNSTTKVLGATSDGTVIEEVFEDGKADQLWKKGEPDAEGYFTLENSVVPKFITAISESGLEIKGNITLRCILLVDYLPCCFFTHRSHRRGTCWTTHNVSHWRSFESNN